MELLIKNVCSDTVGTVTLVLLGKFAAESGRQGNTWKIVLCKSNFFLVERTCYLAGSLSIPFGELWLPGQLNFGICSYEELRNREESKRWYFFFPSKSFLYFWRTSSLYCPSFLNWVSEDCKWKVVQMRHEVALFLFLVFSFYRRKIPVPVSSEKKQVE